MKNKTRFTVDSLPNSISIELMEYVSDRQLTPEELDKLNLEREKQCQSTKR